MIVKPKQIIKYRGKIYTAGAEVPDEAMIDNIRFETPPEPVYSADDTADINAAIDDAESYDRAHSSTPDEYADENEPESLSDIDTDAEEDENPTGSTNNKRKNRKRRSY